MLLWDMPDSMSCSGGRVAYSPDCLQRMWSSVGEWGPYVGGGKEKGEVLMGNRRMACQCQKWSCAEEGVGEKAREDGRRVWLINLFTSLKMLQAPFWLNFSLSSIIGMAALNLQSCRYQTLSQPRILSPVPLLQALMLLTNNKICITLFYVTSWLVRNSFYFSCALRLFMCLLYLPLPPYL